MQSFIVVHTTKDKRDEYLTKILNQHAISQFDITRVLGEKSLGIEEIRNMQKGIFFTSVKGKEKAIILENAHTLTIEAQNALLKVLEEPPVHALFFLSVNSADQLLPTILSRCTLITLEEKQQEITSERIASLDEDFKLLFSHSISARLSLAEKAASQKDDVTNWLAQAIRYLRQIMIQDMQENPSTTVVSTLQHLQEAHHLISTTNTNPRMVLEHTFLNSNSLA